MTANFINTSGNIIANSGNFTTLIVNGSGVSIGGHTHSSSDITNFNSSVSGLLPVKNIIAGSNVSVSSTSGNFTISTTGLQPSGNYSEYGHTHLGDDISIFNSNGDSYNLYAGSNGVNFLARLIDGNIIDGFDYLLTDNIPIPNNYLPTATASGLGIVQAGSGVSISSGIISVNTNYASLSHTHNSSDITNFNSSVSGLLPVKNISSGSGINVSSTSGNFTISVTGLIANPSDNRILTSRDSSGSLIDAESNLTFVDGGILKIDDPTDNVAASLELHNNTSTDDRVSIRLLDGYGIEQIIIYSNDDTNENSIISYGYPLYIKSYLDRLYLSGPSYNYIDLNISSGIDISAPSGINILSNLKINNQTASTIAGFDANKNIASLATSTYPNLTELSYVKGVTSSIQTQLNGKAASSHTHTSSDITNFNSSVSGLVSGVYAPLSGKLNQFANTSSSELSSIITDETGTGLLVFNSSPTLTGIPLVPTATSGTNTNQIASTAFVRTEVSNLVASAPSTLDTLNELASALGNDANFSTTVTNNLANKANLGGASFTGSISAPTGNFTSLLFNGSGVSITGHTHTSSDITNFNSSVSGLLPVNNITAGSGISISASSGIYTININVIDCGQVLAPPNAPTALSATSSNASLVLSWTAPTYAGSTAITGYIVEYTPSGGSASVVNTNSTSTSYTLSGLTNGTSYSVRVRAINSIGNGSYSSSVSSIPSIAGLTVLSALSNAGSYTGAGTLASPISWSGNYQLQQSNIFTVNSNGTLYINVTNELKYAFDSVEGAAWYKNNTFIYSNSSSVRSYNFSTPVNTNDTIRYDFEVFYGGGLRAFTAYVS